MAQTTLMQAAVAVDALAKRFTATVVGREVGLTEAAVRSHATGDALPRARVRERYRAKYKVPLVDWETPAVSTAAPTSARHTRKRPTPSAARSARPVDAREAALDLLQVARAQLEAAQADAGVPYRERAQLITSATGLCRLLARLSGQLEVTEVAIVRSQPWARAMALVRDVLKRHPAAAAELDAALDRFANGGER